MTAPTDVSPDRWLARVRAEYWERLAEAGDGGEPSGPLHVIFRLAGRRFAVEAGLCKGVVRRPRITRLPGVPPHVLGVAGIRGEVISATDPAVLLGLDGERPVGPGYLLILAEAGVKTALWVDRVAAVEPLPPEDVLPVETPWPRAPEGILVGQWGAGTPPLLVLDGRRYLDASAVGEDLDD